MALGTALTSIKLLILKGENGFVLHIWVFLRPIFLWRLLVRALRRLQGMSTAPLTEYCNREVAESGSGGTAEIAVSR